jgi:hypothetical protein
MKIATEVTIDAASETVWRILADTARYPQWNPYIRELHGTLAPGEPIRFRFALAGNITVSDTGARIGGRCGSRAALERSFSGRLVVSCRALARARTDLGARCAPASRQLFSGILGSALRPFLRLWAPGRYRAVNLSLKLRAESIYVERKP